LGIAYYVVQRNTSVGVFRDVTNGFVKKLERYSLDAKDLGQEVVADEGVVSIRILSFLRA
jgi:hypothetical protein